MIRFKVFILCVALVVVSTLAPVKYALADDAVASEESSSRADVIPRINSSEVKFEKKSFFDWFGLKDIPEETIIEEFVLAHLKLEYVDYSLYVLQCDFELKTQLDDGTIVTSNCSYPIDISEYESGLVDSVLIYFNLKDDYFKQVFDYREIVKNAEGFWEYDVTGKGNYTYNTVISQADFYFVRKVDNVKGDSRRFKFTWSEDFKKQLCTKISFSWYRFPTDENEEIEKEIGSQESESGLDGFTTNTTDSYLGLDNSVWDQLISLTVGVPAAVIAFVTGFLSISSLLQELISVVFPFLPGSICGILVFLLYFILIWGIYKFVKGFF